REVVRRLLLLAAERARHVDREPVVDVSTTLAVQLRRALAAQALDGAVLGAGRHPDALRARQRGHLHGGAADGLGDRDRHVHLEVVALAAEHRRVAHTRDYVEVAGRTAAAPGLTLAGQPHAAAFLYARGNVHAVALDLHGLATAAP